MIIRLLRLLKDLDYVQMTDQILKYPIFQKHEQNSILKTLQNIENQQCVNSHPIQDVLNRFILDGIVEDYKAAELPLMHQHLLNVENMIDPARTIWIFDQGYTAMEVYARIIEMNSYFIVRLKIDSYKEERKNITEEDSPISLNITRYRLKKFHDHELKNSYSKEWKMNLRIVTIITNNG